MCVCVQALSTLTWLNIRHKVFSCWNICIHIYIYTYSFISYAHSNVTYPYIYIYITIYIYGIYIYICLTIVCIHVTSTSSRWSWFWFWPGSIARLCPLGWESPGNAGLYRVFHRETFGNKPLKSGWWWLEHDWIILPHMLLVMPTDSSFSEG